MDPAAVGAGLERGAGWHSHLACMPSHWLREV